MRATHFAAATALTALGLLAPSQASALTVSLPLDPSSALSFSNTLTPNQLAVPAAPPQAGLTLQSVQLNLRGTGSGTFVATNGRSTTPTSITVRTPGNLSLTANSQSSPGNTLANTPASGTNRTIAATGGTLAFNITSTTLPGYSWTIWDDTSVGGTSGDLTYVADAGPTGAAFFTSPTPAVKLIPITTLYSVTSQPAGVFIDDGDDGSIYTLNLAGSTVEYTYVPGPLPILGAGAAMAWSRRLKKRISQSA